MTCSEMFTMNTRPNADFDRMFCFSCSILQLKYWLFCSKSNTLVIMMLSYVCTVCSCT